MDVCLLVMCECVGEVETSRETKKEMENRLEIWEKSEAGQRQSK